MGSKRTVAVVTLGGTIACAPDPQGGVTPSTDANFMAMVLGEATRRATDMPETRVVAGPSVASPGTGSLSAFESVVGGPTGSVLEDTVRMTSDSVIDRPVFKLGPSTAIPPVALMKASLADDGRTLAVIDGLGYQGLVVETMGGGSVPPDWVPELERLTATMPVVYTSRALAGPTLRSTYGGPGAELDLRRIGLTPSGLLDGLKARMLLGLLLASSADKAAMQGVWDMFDVPTSRGRRPAFVAPRVAQAR